jgi:hypothetical protein
MPRLKKSATKTAAVAKKTATKTKSKAAAPKRGRPSLASASKKKAVSLKKSSAPKTVAKAKTRKPANALKATKKTNPIVLEAVFIDTLKQVCKVSSKKEQLCSKHFSSVEKKLKQAETKLHLTEEKLLHSEGKVATLASPAAKNQLKNAKKGLHQAQVLVAKLSKEQALLSAELLAYREDLAKYTRLQSVISTFETEWAEGLLNSDLTKNAAPTKAKGKRGPKAKTIIASTVAEKDEEIENTADLFADDEIEEEQADLLEIELSFEKEQEIAEAEEVNVVEFENF